MMGNVFAGSPGSKSRKRGGGGPGKSIRAQSRYVRRKILCSGAIYKAARPHSRGDKP
ncbi:hypothetical protein AZE42_10916 [Rhizopogon vesiculosus]|uniref:Uncharacterized protein n=1 Tax=Rhizopogon vesiculosus TaxID=180088 RepID=A0A1J8QVK7_9AGAM|nr:hypothetical protein AZE42_10916 [Rhizopogon vesiculosus]